MSDSIHLLPDRKVQPRPQTNVPPGAFEFLERLALLQNWEFDVELARQAIRRAARHDGDWPTWLRRVGKDLGWRVIEQPWTAADAARLAQPGSPLLTADQGQWIALLDQRGKRVQIIREPGSTEETWIDQQEVKSPGPWIMIQPLMPFVGIDPAAEDVHGHGHGAGGGHGGNPVVRALQLLRPEWPDVTVVVVLATAAGVLSLVTPITVESLVNTAGAGQLLQQLMVLTLILFLCLASAGGLHALKIQVVELLQQRIFVRLALDLAHRLPRVRVEAFDRQHGPELVNRFFDVLTVQKACAIMLVDGVVVFIQAVIGLMVLAFYHPYLLGFDIGLLAGVCTMVFFCGRGGVATSIRESMAKYAVAGWLEEMVRNPAAFKYGGGPGLALEKTDQLARRYLEARRAHFRIYYRQIFFALAMQVVASTVLLGMGGYLVVERQLTLGQLVAAYLIVAIVVSSLVKLGKSIESFYDLVAAVNKVAQLIDLPLEPISGEEVPTAATPLRVRVSDVTFAYDAHSPPVLHGVSFQVKAGERIAIAGREGCGKSTLLDLLCGMRLPTHGSIELDGFDSRVLRLDDLREQVVLVRGLEVFDGSVFENVRLGHARIGIRHVHEALAVVGLLDEVLTLPDGLNTRLITGGSPLTEGQTRRLVLARAIANRPRLLLIDGLLDGLASSDAVDLFDRLARPDAPWTIILATHEVDLIRRCDRIIQLEAAGHEPKPNGHLE